MWRPIVIGLPGSPCRSAPVIRSSHASADAASGGMVQFEFSLPRSQPQTPGWPASASAVAVASRSCASTTAASAYQLRMPACGGAGLPR